MQTPTAVKIVNLPEREAAAVIGNITDTALLYDIMQVASDAFDRAYDANNEDECGRIASIESFAMNMRFVLLEL